MSQIPPTYSDGRLHAPAAARNVEALVQALVPLMPRSGSALEIASGTGQHVIHFAQAMPQITWQPSDPDPLRRASITAWSQITPSPNIAPPVELDACTEGWSSMVEHDIIFCANLLHLVPAPAAKTCLQEIAKALKPGGRALIYGPFLRDGKTTSDGDAAFHARLQAETRGAGYKDAMWVQDIWASAGLVWANPKAMPANNLLLRADKPQFSN